MEVQGQDDHGVDLEAIRIRWQALKKNLFQHGLWKKHKIWEARNEIAFKDEMLPSQSFKNSFVFVL